MSKKNTRKYINKTFKILILLAMVVFIIGEIIISEANKITVNQTRINDALSQDFKPYINDNPIKVGDKKGQVSLEFLSHHADFMLEGYKKDKKIIFSQKSYTLTEIILQKIKIYNKL